MAKITSINPYTQEINGTFETFSNEQINKIIEQAHHAQTEWKQTSFAERRTLFLKLAEVIEKDLDEIAKLQTMEMGMLYTNSTAWLKWTASLIRRVADNGERILGDQPFESEGIKGKYKHDPLGVIYGIWPWNFPYNQVLRAAVPNIFAGNTTIYKHASNVPMCGSMIQQLFERAWFPHRIYTNIYIESSQSEHILAHPHIAWVNLTWSEGAWSAIWSLAGKYLKPSVLELGGNDPFVLLDHADTQTMIADAVACRISNGGQRCNASKRFIILEKHYNLFVEQMAAYMDTLQRWDPMDPATQLPPISRPDLIDEIDNQVQKTVGQWARLVTGGKRLGDKEQFYAGTVLADVTPWMTSYIEEIFGPVASVIKSSSIEESVALANDSTFWLSAVVYGDNIDQCKQIADRLEWGMVFINQPASSKASLPFGGVKRSGYGKENWPEWLTAFTNKKVIIY